MTRCPNCIRLLPFHVADCSLNSNFAKLNLDSFKCWLASQGWSAIGPKYSNEVFRAKKKGRIAIFYWADDALKAYGTGADLIKRFKCL